MTRSSGDRAAGDFQFGAAIVAQRDGLKVDFVVANDGDLDAGGIEEQGTGGNEEDGVGLGDIQADLAVHAGVELVVGIGEMEFKGHGAGVGIQGPGEAGDGAGEFPSGVVADREFGWAVEGHQGGFDLGHVDEDAQGGGLGEAEEFPARRPALAGESSAPTS